MLWCTRGHDLAATWLDIGGGAREPRAPTNGDAAASGEVRETKRRRWEAFLPQLGCRRRTEATGGEERAVTHLGPWRHRRFSDFPVARAHARRRTRRGEAEGGIDGGVAPQEATLMAAESLAASGREIQNPMAREQEGGWAPSERNNGRRVTRCSLL